MNKIAHVVDGNVDINKARNNNDGKRNGYLHAKLRAEQEYAGGVVTRAAVGGVIFQLIGKGDANGNGR